MKNNDLQQAFRLSLPVLGAFPWRTPCQTVTIIYDACKATPIFIILRLGLDEGIEFIYYFPTTHYHYANRANRCSFVVGCLKIYCSKVSHT